MFLPDVLRFAVFRDFAAFRQAARDRPLLVACTCRSGEQLAILHVKDGDRRGRVEPDGRSGSKR